MRATRPDCLAIDFHLTFDNAQLFKMHCAHATSLKDIVSLAEYLAAQNPLLVVLTHSVSIKCIICLHVQSAY